MPRYMIALYLPDDFDPSTVPPEAAAAIHAYNAELEAAGVLKFACGVSPVASAKTVHRQQSDAKVLVTDGPYIETKEHIAGFLMLDAGNMDEALAWVRKGVNAFSGPVEVRELYFVPDPE